VRALSAALGAAALLTWTGPTAAGDRNALWNVVSEGCVASTVSAGIPFPCVSVDLDIGYAILRPRTAHFLLVPTVPLAGIEAPELTTSDLPNYWDLAWRARSSLSEVLGVELPRDAVALAINSARHRSQDQLHIHLGCVRADVRADLQIYEKDIGDTFSRLPFAVIGQRYWIMKVRDSHLERTSPFQLMSVQVSDARERAEEFTIVVAGAHFRTGEEGFYVLVGRSDVNGTNGEGLLDFDCRVSSARG